MVGAPQYLNALKQLKQELTLAFFDDYIVDIVQERRHVRPCHIVAASKLLHILITNGSTNGMILPTQVEVATKQFLPNCPLRQATDPENWAHRFATHLQQCFSQLRTLLQEENTHKFAKTGAFRRLCDSTQWVVVSGLTSRLNLTPSMGNVIADPELHEPACIVIAYPDPHEVAGIDIEPNFADRC